MKKEYFYYQIPMAFLGAPGVGVSEAILQHFRNGYVGMGQYGGRTDINLSGVPGYDESDVFFSKTCNIQDHAANEGLLVRECQLSIWTDPADIFGESTRLNTHQEVLDATPVPVSMYVMVADVTEPSSLQWIEDTMDRIQRVKQYQLETDFQVVLVGNKCDRIDRKDSKAFERYLELKRNLLDFATKYDCPYIECSALKNIQIEELMEVAVKEAVFLRR